MSKNLSKDYLCGRHAIEACLNQQGKSNYFAKANSLWLKRPDIELEKLAKKNNIAVTIVEKANGLSADIARDLEAHHQLLWIDVIVPSLDLFNWDAAKTLMLVDHITDTQNLGSIMRSACAMNVDGLFYPKHAQASITSRVRFIAQGAAESLPSYRIANVNQWLQSAKDERFWIYGFAENGSLDLHKTVFSDKSVLVVGSEDRGIRSQTATQCDFLIKIPTSSSFSCLNAASAASIMLYERYRQQLAN